MQVGQRLVGRLGTYTIQEQLYRTIFGAVSDRAERVIVKTERLAWQLHNEKAVLHALEQKPHVRHLLDETREPHALVLNRLDGDALDATREEPLRGRDLRFVAAVVLERLHDMHAAKPAGFVHTDVKPRNILVNYGAGGGGARFSEVQLTDFGDAFPTYAIDDLNVQQPVIGSALWRSPEAILGLRWTRETDIWSFGATLLSLMYGRNHHLFEPKGVQPGDPDYQLQVLIKQASHFGPFPDRMMELADEERAKMMEAAWKAVDGNGLRRPFADFPDDEIAPEDKDFLLAFMKLDHRDRPMAQDLLKHAWFDGVGDSAG